MSTSSSAVLGELRRGCARLLFPSRSAHQSVVGGAAPAIGEAGAGGWQAHAAVALIFVQIALLAGLLKTLDMQTHAFRHVVYIAAAGFLINHYLPAKLRLGFFSVLSLGAMMLILGASPERLFNPWPALARTTAIFAFGLLIIGVCNLSIGFWKRALLLALIGCAAAVMRKGILPSGSLAIIWPIIAALFMFRTMIYLYDLSTMKDRPTFGQSLAYFFLIPNVCCALFPVIDFKTFTRSHYNEPALKIYQRGVNWMGRGVIQLLIYRFIDQLASIKAGDVANGTDLARYLITNSFLYLKVSGQFHLFIGLILLFGFNLPETNHRYFFASSFTDYWRRVNIYWKDFMMKVFYYPACFKLKKLGQANAMILATLWTFFITWVLHLYQTWWLKGSAGFSVQDTLFWSALAVLVLGNSLLEMKKGRTRKLTTGRYSPFDALSLTLKTGATFATISVLWSLWSADSLGTWLHAWSMADRYTLLWGACGVAVIMTGKFVVEVLPEMRARPATRKLIQFKPADAFGWPAYRSLATLGLIFVLAQPMVQSRLTTAAMQPYRDALAAGDSMTGDGAQRGYYERLTNADDANRDLWETLMRRRMEPSYAGEDPIRPLMDFRFREYLPSAHLAAYDTDFQTNRWSMRDREYELANPQNNLRIAVLGSSHTMGWGVPQDQVFSRLVETRLNESLRDGRAIEVMNFATNGMSPLGQIDVLDKRAAAFGPEIVLFVAHTIDEQWVRRDLPRALRQKIEITNPFLLTVLADARVTARTPAGIADERLERYGDAVTEWSYRQIVQRCVAIGAVPVCAFVPLPAELPMDPRVAAARVQSLERAGFVVLDLSQVFDGKDAGTLVLNEPLKHSTPAAHALIAGRLSQEFLNNPSIAIQRKATPTRTRRDGRPAADTSPKGRSTWRP